MPNTSSNLTQETTTGQYLALHQMRLAKILELSPQELEERVAREVEENPALEVVDDKPERELTEDGTPFEETAEDMRKADYANADDTPYYRVNINNRSADDDRPDRVSPDTTESIYDVLRNQLSQRDMSDDVRVAADNIIGNLDSNGWLQRTPQGIADDIEFRQGIPMTAATVEKGLEVVQSMEPYGLGARNLRECLLIQLRHRRATPVVKDAIDILENAYEAFRMRHSHRIISTLHMSAERVERATELIRTLNPKPGASLGSGQGSTAQPVIPDFIVEINDGHITVSVNNKIPELRIAESFETALKQMRENSVDRRRRKEVDFLNRTNNEAKDFINLLQQRQRTLFSVMTAIVNRQKEYFITEDVHTLKPMGIKDIAEDTGYDVSVISRSTKDKYVETPRGIVPLRFFFSDSLGDNESGTVFTAKGVQDVMRQLVDNEDKRHPLSDDKLTKMLQERGYDVSRRTVAKYRDRLEIPVARLRKQF